MLECLRCPVDLNPAACCRLSSALWYVACHTNAAPVSLTLVRSAYHHLTACLSRAHWDSLSSFPSLVVLKMTASMMLSCAASASSTLAQKRRQAVQSSLTPPHVPMCNIDSSLHPQCSLHAWSGLLLYLFFASMHYLWLGAAVASRRSLRWGLRVVFRSIAILRIAHLLSRVQRPDTRHSTVHRKYDLGMATARAAVALLCLCCPVFYPAWRDSC